MTTEDKKAKEKKIPDYYIFIEEDEGKRTIKGSAFQHKKGKGLTILIGNTRYVAFPPKDKSQTETGESA